MTTTNGAAMAVFSVRLSEASTNEIRVGWQTEDGTGHAGTDYKAATGTLVFPAGALEQTLQVEVYGRSPTDSTEDRSFLIRLNPPVDAMLQNATAECVIQVVAQDGNVFTQVYIPAGPRGRPGNIGNDGLNTFELAKLNGFAGTLTQWLATVTGRNVELINDGTWIKWRPVDFENPQPWVNLIELATLQGGPGDDGREVQMQKSATAIQWRYTSEVTWHDLVQLDELKADPQPLVNRGNWATATTYNPGDYVAATSTASAAKSLYFLLDAVPYVSNTEPKSDLTHWVELQPPQGAKGDNIELQKGATFIQWRVVGDAAWQNLIAISELKGDNGRNPELQLNTAQTAVEWRLEGDTDWQTLFALALIKGADGKNIELQKGATFIQWRVVGDTAWQNLIAIADLTGAPGTNGTNGATWYSGTGAPATGTGVVNDFYLRNDTGGIYKKTAAAVWTLQMTITVSGGGTTWLIVTTDPVAGTGADGNMALNTVNGKILQKASGAWSTLITIPLEATTAEAKAATLTGKFSSPARVREFLESLGLGATFMDNATDLNLMLKNAPFAFSQDTLNIPVAGGWGRGWTVNSDANNLTQFAIINGTGALYIRYLNGGVWGTWGPLPSGKPVLCAYNNPGGATFAGNAWQTLKLFSKIDDDATLYSSSTGKFTTPSAGLYRVSAVVRLTTQNIPVLVSVLVGSTRSHIGQAAAITGIASAVSGEDVIKLAAGDLVEIGFYHNNATAQALNYASFCFEKIA